MVDLGPHAVFIVAAYLGVAAVTAGLIIAVLVNAWITKRKLAALEAARKPETRK